MAWDSQLAAVPVDVWVFTLIPTLFAGISIVITLTTIVHLCRQSSKVSPLIQYNSIGTLFLLTVCMVLCVIHSFNYFESHTFEHRMRYSAVMSFLVSKLALYLLFLHKMHDRFVGTQYDVNICLKISYLLLTFLVTVLLIISYTYFYITNWDGKGYYLTSMLYYGSDFIISLFPFVVFTRTLLLVIYAQTYQLTEKAPVRRKTHASGVFDAPSRDRGVSASAATHMSASSLRSHKSVDRDTRISKSKNYLMAPNASAGNDSFVLTNNNYNNNYNNIYATRSDTNVYRASVTSHQTQNSLPFSLAQSNRSNYNVYEIGTERFVFNATSGNVQDVIKYALLLTVITVGGWIVSVLEILFTLEVNNQTPIFGHDWNGWLWMLQYISCFVNVFCVYLIFDFTTQSYQCLCGCCRTCYLWLPLCLMRQRLAKEVATRRETSSAIESSGMRARQNDNNAASIYYDVYREDSLI